MKVINTVFLLIFLLSALLQLNDPDPVLWIVIYLSGAFLSFLAMRKKLKPIIALTAIAVYSVLAIYQFFSSDGVLSWITDHDAENIVQSMKADKPWIEETREFIGLLILITACIVNLLYLKAGKQSETEPKL